ncbi:pentapeptide repeat-containing protein [Streptomyces sp. B6B3]|uniref:pentapeptide repeat-containing protein n=1 Tax=Streptomyces sp. B6B3 TaxID=3153570 RepID=UPI00325EB9E7
MRRIVGWGFTGIGVVVFFALLWQGPWWFDGAHLRETDLEPADGVVITGFRTTLVAIGAGIVAGLGLYYTDRNLKHTRELFEHTREKDRQEAELTREGQVTGRYVEAIKLLGSENMTERLGGIYALERIMRDSERDHPTVVEVLAAYIRHHAPAPPLEADPDAEDTEQSPEEHVQAALTVLCRRPRRDESFRINLAHTDLRRADLRDAHLEGVILRRARMEGADLRGAHLKEAALDYAHLEGADLRHALLKEAILVAARFEGADLRHALLKEAILVAARLEGAHLFDARLEGAILRGAHLKEAILIGAHLEGAELQHAGLEGTDLRDAHLQGAILSRVDLSGAVGLTVDQLVVAWVWRTTVLPSECADDPRIRARIAEYEAQFNGSGLGDG